MKDRISKLARGIIDSEVPKLQMSESSFKRSLPAGEIHHISTVLSSMNEVMLKGLIYSTHPRVQTEKTAFGGLRSRIGCEVNTVGLRDGDTIEGLLTIVSNAGEWQLPYLFLVREKKEEEKSAWPPVEEGEYPYPSVETDSEESAFRKYLSDIEEGSTELYLYEHLLETMPEKYAQPLPRELYLYFAYGKNLAEPMALRLYGNILRAFSAGSDIYQRFEHRMREFALDALISGKLSDGYALLYEKFLYPAMPDNRVSRLLPRLLHTYRISVKAEGLERVIVRYPEFEKERSYPMRGKLAYVPLIFPDGEILFRDSEGRYWRLPCEKRLLVNREDLRRGTENSGEFRYGEIRGILKSGIQKLSQLRLCEDCFREEGLSDSFRRELAAGILRFHARMSYGDREKLEERDRVFLKELPEELLNREELLELLRTLVRLRELRRAAELYFENRSLPLERDLLEELLSYCLRETRRLGNEAESENSQRLREEELTGAVYQAVQAGSRRKELLLHLLLHYNTVSWTMRELLEKAVEAFSQEKGQKRAVSELPTEERQAVHEMSERLLVQMLFTGMEDGMNQVHALYAESGETEALIEKAFISKRCELYFLRGRKADKDFFKLLYSLIHRENIKDRLPLIHLLAMSKYMSEQESLSEEEKLELQEMMNVLTEKDMIFAYTEKLRRFIPLPDSVNRSYIEYRSDSGEKPVLYVKILPEEEKFHEEELRRVYQNIYVCPLLLFSGEQAVYKICRVGEEIPVSQGSVKLSPESLLLSRGDTYGILNEMSEMLEKEDYRGLLESMLHYTRNEAMIQRLFVKGDRKQ